MKQFVAIFIFVLVVSSSFAITNLMTQNFNSPVFPVGWTRSGTIANWTISNSANAGGDAYELMFNNSPTNSGLRRFISPAFNTTNYFELELQFRHYLLDNPATPNNYTFGVQVSSDLINWTDIWVMNASESFGPELMDVFVPSDYLNTTTLYIAFYFDGAPSDLLFWYIDNVRLDVSRMGIFGTWSGMHYLTENVGVPVGRTLILQPGTQVIAQADCGIVVNGTMRAEGTAADSIRFTATDHNVGWRGIYYYSTDMMTAPLVFRYCTFEWGNGAGSCAALFINSVAANVEIRNCRFTDNRSSWVAGLYVFNNNDITVDQCLFKNNRSDNCPSLLLYAGGTTTLTNSVIRHNLPETQSSISQVQFQSNSGNAHLIVDGNTIANNGASNYTLQALGVSFMNLYYSAINLSNNIFWNPNSTSEIYFNSAMNGGNPQLSYCDIRSQLVTGNSGIYLDCVWSSPLFASQAICTLSGSSPCVDSGDPALFDPDGSRKDMGALPVFKNPVLISVQDVPYDQGRVVKVKWSRSQCDAGGYAGGYYSVFRLDESRSANGTFIRSPLELNGLTAASDVWWHYRDVDYNWMGNVPAFNFPLYSLNCPTLQDSSSTGTHPCTYIVVYSYGNWFAVSNQVSGYSHDNIAPLPPTGVRLSQTTPSQLNLVWTEVTEGIWEGNSYPEINQISYKIYGGASPNFIPDPTNLIMQTSNPQAILALPSADYKFYRIIATDSQ